MSLNAQTIDMVKDILNFPIDLEQTQRRKILATANSDIAAWLEEIAQYERVTKERMNDIRARKLEAYKIKKELPPEKEKSSEEIRTMFEELSTLPWIEKLKLERSGSLFITTAPNILKTTFDVGLVLITGNSVEEYLPEPVSVPLPQYEIFINLQSIGGGSWSNSIRNLAIRVINPTDVSSFAGRIFGYQQEVHAHWGSSGGRFMEWEKICLGDWEEDFTRASYKGLKDMLIELSMYLQVSGDEGSAYRRKEKWAAWLGKADYNFILRQGLPEESVLEAQQKYQAEYRKRHEPTSTVPPHVLGIDNRGILRAGLDFTGSLMAMTGANVEQNEVDDDEDDPWEEED